MANSLTLNYAYYYIYLYLLYYYYRNNSMIAYIIEIQKSKFADILFREFDHSEPGR